MFQRILVPLDGSARAEHALEPATSIARAEGGTLLLARVVPPPHRLSPLPVPVLPSASAQTMMEVERGEAEQYLRTLTISPELHTLHVEQIVLAGSPVPTLLALATLSRCDLIVLCRHGATPVSSWEIGSVAEKVLHEARVPVLLLSDARSRETTSSSPSQRCLRALVSLDGSLQAERALLPAATLLADLARPGEGILHLFQVVQPPPGRKSQGDQADEGWYASVTQGLQGYLSATADRLRKTIALKLHLSITWSFTFAEDIAQTLLALVEPDINAGHPCEIYDLLAMSTYGRGGRHQMIGGVVERLLRRTHLPFLLVSNRGHELKEDRSHDMPKLQGRESCR